MLKFYPFLHHYKLVTVALRWVNFICTWWINSIDYQQERVIIDGGAFSYRGKYYQLVTKAKGIAVLPKAKITVLDNPKRGIRAMYRGEVFETIMLEERPKKSAPENKPRKKERVYSKPSANHPWRKGFKEKPKLYYEETDSEILEILDELFSSTRAWV